MPVTFKWLDCKQWEENGEVIDQSTVNQGTLDNEATLIESSLQLSAHFLRNIVRKYSFTTQVK